MSAATVTLSAGLEIRDVEQVRGRLLEALDGASAVRIDLSGIVAADTAGVQLLLALRAEALYRGIAVEFVEPTPAFARLLGSLGLDARLGAVPAHVT